MAAGSRWISPQREADSVTGRSSLCPTALSREAKTSSLGLAAWPVLFLGTSDPSAGTRQRKPRRGAVEGWDTFKSCFPAES